MGQLKSVSSNYYPSVSNVPWQGYFVRRIIPASEIPLIKIPTLFFRTVGDSRFQNQASIGPFTGGVNAIAEVKTINVLNNAGITPAVTTLTVGLTVYTFDTTPGLGKILIGLTAADTENNIVAVLQNDLSLIGIQNAEISGGLVRITGAATGATFALSTTAAPADIAIATVTAGVGPVGATAQIEFVTVNNQPLNPGDIIQIWIDVNYQGQIVKVMFRYVIQAGDTLANIGLKVAQQFGKLAASGTGNLTIGVAGVRLKDPIPFNYTSIKAAVSAILQSVTGSGNAMTFTLLSSLGARGNNQDVYITMSPSIPDIPIDSDGTPILNGLYNIGPCSTPVTTAANVAQTAIYTQQAVAPFYPSAPTAEQTVTFEVMQYADFQVALMNAFNVGGPGDGSYTVAPNAGLRIEPVSLIFVQPSAVLPNRFNVMFIRNCQITNAQVVITKEGSGNAPINGTIYGFSDEAAGIRAITPYDNYITGN
jgi:hypothetical protein